MDNNDSPVAVPKCDCKIAYGSTDVGGGIQDTYVKHIIYCPLHNAAQDMLAALRRARDDLDAAILNASHRPNKDVRDEIVAAIAKTKFGELS